MKNYTILNIASDIWSRGTETYIFLDNIEISIFSLFAPSEVLFALLFLDFKSQIDIFVYHFKTFNRFLHHLSYSRPQMPFISFPRHPLTVVGICILMNLVEQSVCNWMMCPETLLFLGSFLDTITEIRKILCRLQESKTPAAMNILPEAKEKFKYCQKLVSLISMLGIADISIFRTFDKEKPSQM